MDILQYLLVALAAMAAGAINALAGGGTLITFPTLVALGIPPVSANVTNTVALVPGYLGGIAGQAKDLKGQGRRWWLGVVGFAGGILGGYLLLNTQEKIFAELVPYLILMASGLLALQDPLRAWLVKRAQQQGKTSTTELGAALPVFLASIYGGYFGAGLSVIILAVLGLVLDDTLTRLNAVKQAISFCVNIAAALFFVFSGRVVWPVALVMAIGALVGGAIGGRLAGIIHPATLRKVVVVVGIVVGVLYLLR